MAASTWNLTCHRGIDVKNIGLTPEQRGSLVDDPKGMVFPNPTLMEEVILEEIKIGFIRIVRREELSIGRNDGCRLRHLANDTWLRNIIECDRNGRTHISDDSLPRVDDCTVVEPLYREICGGSIGRVSVFDLVNGLVKMSLCSGHDD